MTKKNQVVEQQEIIVQSESATILQIIERAAQNPDVDIDKMERLLDMKERVMAKESLTLYNTALAALQQDLPVIQQRGGIKNRDGKVQSKYALWEDINEAIKPHLGEHGFAISFRVGNDEALTTVTGVLSHIAGHSEETTMSLPSDTSGSKNNVQALGSSISYGKRYTCMALLNLTTTGEDDDGVKAGGGFITDEQADTIKALLETAQPKDTDWSLHFNRFLKHMELENLNMLPAKRFNEAVMAINARINK